MRGTAGLAAAAAASVVSSVAVGGPGFAAFTSEAAARGVFYFADFGFATWGQGLGFADLDNDGDEDLVATGTASGLVGVWENDGAGVFTDRTFDALLPINPRNDAVSFADYDRDGDLDIYISVEGAANRLVRNNGGFSFSDVTATAGVGDPGLSQSSSWGDIDGDGWLDLFVGNRALNASPFYNRMYRNNGDGTFADVTVASGLYLFEVATFVGGFFDADFDGDVDLYLANDKGRAGGFPCNRFYGNAGGVFTDVSDASGGGVCMDGMSVALGDFNRDLKPDVYVTNSFDGAVFLFGDGAGGWTRQEVATGTQSFNFCWGAQLIDLDNDGWQELFVLAQFEDDHLYRHTGSFPASDIAAAVGLAGLPGDNYAVAYADIDGDGDMDMAVNSQGASLRLLINNEGSERNYLRVKPLGAEGLAAFNSRAEITAGGVQQYAELMPGSGFKSGNQQVMHFGLGGAVEAELVEVTWPDGRRGTLRGVAANQTLELPGPCGAADVASGFGSLDANDVIEFVLGFNEQRAAGDVSPAPRGDGLFNANDVIDFVVGFNAGCP